MEIEREFVNGEKFVEMIKLFKFQYATCCHQITNYLILTNLPALCYQ